MRLGIMSDLHLDLDRRLLQKALEGGDLSDVERKWLDCLKERAERDPGHPDAGPDLAALRGNVDVLILAGDVAPGVRAIAYAGEAARYCGSPVVFVPGNHEYYGGDFFATRSAMVQAASATDHVFLIDHGCGEPLTMTFAGRSLAIVGATLWTDYCLNGHRDEDRDRAMRDAGRILKDHQVIAYNGRNFSPGDALTIHEAARLWLVEKIRALKAGHDAIAVVTHHAPVAEAIAEQFKGGALSPAFASDLSREIADLQPDLWISGHSHHNHDISIGSTRCLSHQRGYIGVEAGAEAYAPLIVTL